MVNRFCCSMNFVKGLLLVIHACLFNSKSNCSGQNRRRFLGADTTHIFLTWMAIIGKLLGGLILSSMIMVC